MVGGLVSSRAEPRLGMGSRMPLRRAADNGPFRLRRHVVASRRRSDTMTTRDVDTTTAAPRGLHRERRRICPSNQRLHRAQHCTFTGPIDRPSGTCRSQSLAAFSTRLLPLSDAVDARQLGWRRNEAADLRFCCGDHSREPSRRPSHHAAAATVGGGDDVLSFSHVLRDRSSSLAMHLAHAGDTPCDFALRGPEGNEALRSGRRHRTIFDARAVVAARPRWRVPRRATHSGPPRPPLVVHDGH